MSFIVGISGLSDTMGEKLGRVQDLTRSASHLMSPFPLNRLFLSLATRTLLTSPPPGIFQVLGSGAHRVIALPFASDAAS